MPLARLHCVKQFALRSMAAYAVVLQESAGFRKGNQFQRACPILVSIG
jgi:hypothetical protein